jgi:hypothetical protein
LTAIVFLLGAAVAVTNLFIKESSGDLALPTLFGVTGVLPCLPGLAAVVLLWKTGRPRRAVQAGDEAVRLRQLWGPPADRGGRR